MSKIHLSFSGHGPVLKKMSIVMAGDAPQIKCEIERNGERAGVAFNFANMVRGITYTFEDDLIYSAKRELSGDLLNIYFNMGGTPRPPDGTIDAPEQVSFYYLADGESRTEITTSRRIAVPSETASELYAEGQPRLTLTARHFVRSLPSSVPGLISRAPSDILADLDARNALQLQAGTRFDNTANYFRGLIGFAWREIKNLNKGTASTKSVDRLRRIVETLETEVMGKPSHHAIDWRRSDFDRESDFVLHFFVEHDVDAWREKFAARTLWLSDGGYRPAGEVYDVDAQHEDGGGDAARQEFAGLLTAEFAECLFSGYRELAPERRVRTVASVQ